MILHTPGNEPYFDKNDTFSGWQKRSIFGVCLKSSIQLQRKASLDPWYRLVYDPNI